MATETLFLANFIRLMAIVFLLIATTKIVLLSKETSWDGWSIISISLALLAISSVLGIFNQFGVYFANIREIIALVSGLLAASAFLMSTRIIKKGSKQSK